MKKMLLTAGLLALLGASPALAQTAAQPAADAQPAAAADARSQETIAALKALSCTVEKVQICTADGCKASETFGEIALPAKVLVHPERRIVAGVSKDGLPHISTIQVFQQTENDLSVQGFDGEVGWTIMADRKDDTMTFAAASDHTVLTGFGTCKDIDE